MLCKYSLWCFEFWTPVFIILAGLISKLNQMFFLEKQSPLNGTENTKQKWSVLYETPQLINF